ncbi:MAG: hypothetical protein GC162_10360 [Planctomycetes bacterium]|nr:hypothetical protein [Planctomycetota bacterium]
MSYTIDGVAVNSRTDWQHTPLPGPAQNRREDGFPGIAERIVFTGPAMPPDLVVMGYLEGSSTTAELANQSLIGQVLTHANLRGSSSTHSVAIHGYTFANCELASFEVIGPVETVDPAAGTIKVQRLARWSWRQLKR